MYTWKQLVNKERGAFKMLNSLSGIIRVRRGGRTMPVSRVGERKLGYEEWEEFGKAEEGHFSGQNTHTPSQKAEVET